MNTHNRVRVTTKDITAFILTEGDLSVDYNYGGARLVPHDTSDTAVVAILHRLCHYESGLKNRLINRAIVELHDHPLIGQMPKGFANSTVGGARVVLRPNSKHLHDAIQALTPEAVNAAVIPMFKELGAILNSMNGKIKLTPDFGRFSGLADLLHRYTPHVLGVDCNSGGCGGKSSYTTTGIMSQWNEICPPTALIPTTIIGSNGALGADVHRRVLSVVPHQTIAFCDVAYGAQTSYPAMAGQVLPAEHGRFTDDCLRRGGTIIATTVGDELANSSYTQIPQGSTLLLAHNLSLPDGDAGLELAARLHKQQVLTVPGQLMTLGGALTSRIEWFFRQTSPRRQFDAQMKAITHQVVALVSAHLVRRVASNAANYIEGPYARMLCYAADASMQRRSQ